jgi:hypothetical protein
MLERNPSPPSESTPKRLTPDELKNFPSLAEEDDSETDYADYSIEIGKSEEVDPLLASDHLLLDQPSISGKGEVFGPDISTRQQRDEAQKIIKKMGLKTKPTSIRRDTGKTIPLPPPRKSGPDLFPLDPLDLDGDDSGVGPDISTPEDRAQAQKILDEIGLPHVKPTSIKRPTPKQNKRAA